MNLAYIRKKACNNEIYQLLNIVGNRPLQLKFVSTTPRELRRPGIKIQTNNRIDSPI